MESVDKYIAAIENYVLKNYKNNFREPCDRLPFHFLVPGANYTHQLWDWDSWLTGYALMEINDPSIEKYEKGSVLNFLASIDEQGRIPILIEDRPNWLFDIDDKYKSNIHKPCLAIQALEISLHYNDVNWIKNDFDKILKFNSFYEKNQKHQETGLYFWLDDLAIGFDNDPTVFYSRDKSTASIYLNCLMHEELLAISKLAKLLGKNDIEEEYIKKADELKKAIRKECYDPIDGFYYSSSFLRPVDKNEWLHSNHPRFWSTLPIKITTWAGMLSLWSNVATKQEAKRIVKKYLDSKGLCSKYGIRSLAKNEKMYGVFDTGNPSCWIGPIWINANYFTYVGLKNYGYNKLAKEIALKTIKLLGQDIIKNGDFHEYYDPETGKGVRGLGFQSWNFLVLKMVNDLKKDERK